MNALSYIYLLIFSIVFVNANAGNPPGKTAVESPYLRYTLTTDKSFEDVMYDLQFAITDRSFRVTSINRVGEAIIREKEQDFVEANIVNFCNIDFAQDLLKESLETLLYMPCRAAVYEQEDQVVIETYLFTDDDPLYQNMNKMLKDILHYAVKE